jgi:hypothetical protein
MLLASFHGGSGGINNVVVYSDSGTVQTSAALTGIKDTDLSELRGLVWNSPYLYVANGKSSKSDVLCFQPQTSPNYLFNYIGEFVSPTFSKKENYFETSIAHPYALAFDALGYCFISNQDTNVVARATVSSNRQSGDIGKGSQSLYLTNLCKGGVYLDGTFAGSEVGALANVKNPPSDILTQYGGLSANIVSGKVQNSVRDVAVNGGILYVCDEPSSMLRLYTAGGSTPGTYLGSGSTLPGSPTHLSLQSPGLYVSANNTLLWCYLIPPTPGQMNPWNLFFQPVLTVPSTLSGYSIGGLAFDQTSHVYVAFQKGKGGVGTGAIYMYTITQANTQTAPTLSNPQVIASGLADTPEFLLYLPG